MLKFEANKNVGRLLASALQSIALVQAPTDQWPRKDAQPVLC